MFLKRLFGMLPPDPFVDGLQLMERGELRQAIAAFQAHLESEDEGVRNMAKLYSCEAWLQLGNDICETDVREALHCFEKASELEPTFADVQHRVGRARLRLGDLDLAAQFLNRALEINENFLSARIDLLEVCIRRKDAQWREHLDFLTASQGEILGDELSEIISACESSAWTAAIGHVEAVRERNPSMRQRLKEAAVRALRLGEPEEAVRQLNKMLGRGRRYPDLLQLMGLAQAQLDLHVEAEKSFREAIEVHPGYTKARVNLALTLMELQRWNEAESQLEIVLEQDPTHPLAQGALEEIRAHCEEI